MKKQIKLFSELRIRIRIAFGTDPDPVYILQSLYLIIMSWIKWEVMQDQKQDSDPDPDLDPKYSEMSDMNPDNKKKHFW
jgi:hypothetical protein